MPRKLRKDEYTDSDKVIRRESDPYSRESNKIDSKARRVKKWTLG